MEKITLAKLRFVMEKWEDYVKVLSDDELLHSTLHRDLGLDSLAAFSQIAQGLGLNPNRYSIKDTMMFFKKDYQNWTVEEYLSELNRVIARHSINI